MMVSVKLKKCKKATEIHDVVAHWKHDEDLIILTKIKDGHCAIVYAIKDVEEFNG